MIINNILLALEAVINLKKKILQLNEKKISFIYDDERYSLRKKGKFTCSKYSLNKKKNLCVNKKYHLKIGSSKLSKDFLKLRI